MHLGWPALQDVFGLCVQDPCFSTVPDDAIAMASMVVATTVFFFFFFFFFFFRGYSLQPMSSVA